MRRLTHSPGVRSEGSRRARSFRPTLEILEDRIAPTVDPASGLAGPWVHPSAQVENHAVVSPAGGPGQPAGFSPGQISQAYGFNRIRFGNGTITGTGQGQTIAIVDAYNQPNLASNLHTFDATYGLADPPSFRVVNQNGDASLPAANAGWGVEESLDVEWAHAMAPGADILLVEANSASMPDLMAAVDFARSQPDVSVVSMSWGSSEWSGESDFDGYFTTPSDHPGVTFVASTGDSGSAGAPEAPSIAPNVLAVGGTQLSTDSAGNYLGETAWSGSGGGISVYESQPSYQRGVVKQTNTQRAVPDVAYDASTNTPFAVYDTSSYGGWLEVYGTSAGAPQWAALIAIANQGRALAGQSSLDGGTQTLPTLYRLPGSDFHDITSGGNGGYAAGSGYDLVTGRGSPIANLIVAGLVGSSTNPPPANSPPTNQTTTSPSPWLVTSASTSANPVHGTTTNLHVLANDHSGTSSLTYTWSVLSAPAGAPSPTFNVNGTNAAQNATVTFYQAGTYVFQATIVNPAGLTVTSNVMVLVAQTLTSVVITPGNASVSNGSTQQFTAVARDQFGNAMNSQAGWTWTVQGAGAIDGNGLYTAPSGGTGTALVQVSGGGLTSTVSVSFAPALSPPLNPALTPVVFNPADPWATWQSILDAFMTELALFESLWESMLRSWNG